MSMGYMQDEALLRLASLGSLSAEYYSFTRQLFCGPVLFG